MVVNVKACELCGNLLTITFSFMWDFLVGWDDVENLGCLPGNVIFIKENLIASDKETENFSGKVPLNTICNSWRTSKSKETNIYMVENTESI